MNREHLLVVDDEPAMVHAVARVLASHYTVATAATGDAALERARENRPDLAVLDIRMPRMDGFQLAARLREVVPGLDVIFMTGAIQELDAQLIRSIRERAFYFIQKPFDREVLLTLVERCLELRRLAAENRRHVERLEEELREARSFQESLLPETEAVLDGVEIAARCRPCAELGGDLYDYAAAGTGRATVLVADVSGHGASAAMLTGIVKACFQDTRESDHDPAAVVRAVARGIRSLEPHRFVTLVCARIAADGRTVEYVNAGHPAGIVWGGRVEPLRLGPTGPLISPVFPDREWETRRLHLEPGDRLLLYTDGVTEAAGEEGAFEERRLLQSLGGDGRDGEGPRDARSGERPGATRGRRSGETDAGGPGSRTAQTRSRERSGGGPGVSREARSGEGVARSGGALLDEVLDAVRTFQGGRPAEDDQTLLTARILPARR